LSAESTLYFIFFRKLGLWFYFIWWTGAGIVLIYAGIIFVEAVRWSASCEEKIKAERERLKKGDIKIRDFFLIIYEDFFIVILERKRSFSR